MNGTEMSENLVTIINNSYILGVSLSVLVQTVSVRDPRQQNILELMEVIMARSKRHEM